MKDKRIQQQLQFEENMSNLTTASGEASVSESNPQSSFVSPAPSPAKKKRSMQGYTDPEAEVIALSPKTLMTANRFVCEMCSKGFKRDQNLQLHRRGHNLPWKLKQRGSKEVKKKVYICPEITCPNHDPSRALGDLTGIKKHFSRKHGEKKWKCEKCSKKYAVQSDWKAHSKICGTREYRCDCGTRFSRRDSFNTHRSFCGALAEVRARAITLNNSTTLGDQIFSQQSVSVHPQPSTLQQTIMQGQLPLLITSTQTEVNANFLKKEHNYDHIPPWLLCNQGLSSVNSTPMLTSSDDHHQQHYTSNSTASVHLSAAALLQKAAQMGATMSCIPSHLAQMTSHTSTTAIGVGPGQEIESGSLSGMIINNALPLITGFDGPFEDAFGGIIGQTREVIIRSSEGFSENVETTRDFLGIQRAFYSA